MGICYFFLCTILHIVILEFRHSFVKYFKTYLETYSRTESGTYKSTVNAT